MSTGHHALVTGATGYIGGHLCRHLLAAGYEVTALVRPNRDASALRELGIRIVLGKLADPEPLQRAMTGVDIVYHIAFAFRDASLPDKVFFETNVKGTENVMRAAAAARVRRVAYCSSVGVHGNTGRTPANEESPFNAPDYYCQTKIEAEQVVRKLSEELGVPASIFRRWASTVRAIRVFSSSSDPSAAGAS